MDPTYTLDITNLVGILQRIVEFALHLLDHGFVALSLSFYKVDGPMQRHHQHLQPRSCVVGFSTNTIFTISGSL